MRTSIRSGDTMYFRPTGAKVVITRCLHTKDEYDFSPAQGAVKTGKASDFARLNAWKREQGLHSASVVERQARLAAEELRRQERLNARQGNSPDHDMTHEVPLGYHVKGVSTLYDKDGNLTAQWVKSQVDEDAKIEAMLAAFESMAEKLPREELIPESGNYVSDDIVCVYPMGDPHIGMHAWAEETQDKNFDLKIAEAQLVVAADKLITLAPASREALILNLGDFFHADNMQNRTMRSGAALDVDTRWARILAVGVRLMCRIIERALEKHQHVTVRNEIGNHDDHTSIMLSICLQHHYMNNPRVQIDVSPAKYWYYEFGKTLIGTTHGDTVKLDRLPGIMAVDKAQEWGRTVHRYWYTGHVHTETVKEYPGVTVETFRTLAPRDAWASGQGYRSGQDMRLDVIHREFGRINRHIVGVDMLTAGIAE